MHRLSIARASSDRERVKQEKERLQNLEVIAAEVRNDTRRVLPQPELDRLLDEYRSKYGRDFDEFREEFYAKYTVPKERRNLAVIQPLGTAYVHRDNLYRVFLDRFQDVQAELNTLYLGLMVEFIRSRSGAHSDVFASNTSFCADIRQRLPKVDRVLGELFAKPFLLAEVIIFGEKKRRKVSSIDEVRSILARFFVSDQMEPRDLATVFELNMVELFETAFLQFSVLLQIWYKLTGRYDTLRETILRRFGSKLPGFRDASPSEAPVTRPDSGPRGIREARSAHGTKSASPTRPSRPMRDAQKAKYYSRREQEKAWQEFTEALKH